MLENTRFHPGETKNDESFARQLADDRDLYVDDAFGSAHRAHASTVAVARLLPAYAGLLLLAELVHLGRLLEEPESPFVLVTGGAKVEDKLGVLRNLGGRADAVLVGGKMAEELRTENPLAFPVELPLDVVAASEFAEDAETSVTAYDEIPDGWLGLDIGPRSRERFASIIATARTVFWNGPMGVFEWPRFAEGTARSPRRSRTPTATPSSAEATPSGRSRSSASQTGSRGSPPAEGPHSSCSRARSCPALPSSHRLDEAVAEGGRL